jgi:hypothetical protein
MEEALEGSGGLTINREETVVMGMGMETEETAEEAKMLLEVEVANPPLSPVAVVLNNQQTEMVEVVEVGALSTIRRSPTEQMLMALKEVPVETLLLLPLQMHLWSQFLSGPHQSPLLLLLFATDVVRETFGNSVRSWEVQT